MTALWIAIGAIALASVLNYQSTVPAQHNRVLYLAERAETDGKIHLSIQLVSLIVLAVVALAGA